MAKDWIELKLNETCVCLLLGVCPDILLTMHSRLNSVFIFRWICGRKCTKYGWL